MIRVVGGSRWRRVAVWLCCCVMAMALAALPAAGSVGGGVSPAAEGGASPVLAAPPVIAGSPVESEQVEAGREAKLASPEAVALRKVSRTRYENQRPAEAARTDGEAFPYVAGEPAGGPPKLPAGERITEFMSDDTARLALPGGKHGVLVSTEPMAVEASSGHFAPIDLALHESEGAFEPKATDVPVRIPERLSAGVQLPGAHVSLTPVDARGAALAGSEGKLDGASVFYGDSEDASAGVLDADTLVKPEALGFSEETFLRSRRSPRKLFFRVNLPRGATLAQSTRSGEARILDAGQTLAMVSAPDARDAAGTPVPVSMSVSGDTIALTVGEAPGGDQYPVDVDPSVTDKQDAPGNWKLVTDNKTGFCWQIGETLGVFGCQESKGFERGQYGDLVYATQGESKIDRFSAETQTSTGSEYVASYMSIGNSAYEAGPLALPTTRESHELSVVSPSDANAAAYEVIAIKSASKAVLFESGMEHAEVTVQQENGPHVTMNTTSEVVGEGYQNALYGNRWVNTTSGKWALQANATDPGLGVDSVTWDSSNFPEWDSTWHIGCNGVECGESWSPTRELHESAANLPEGEDTVEAKAEDPVGLSADTEKYKVKIDNVPPHNIVIAGLASGGEVEGGSTDVKLEATDGEGSTPSSGVKSFTIAVDGRELGKPAGSCSPGPCTAKAEWGLNGAEFSNGEHKLKVTVTDYAGNAASEEISFKVHHAAPVSLGPGLVEPLSGELTLTATDVSVSAPGSSLTVSRSYRSRHLTAGAEGPLGPQWSLSVGGQESITRQVGGNATLTTSSGAQTTFTTNEKGGFTAPAGDSNLALSEVKNEKGELMEYVLKESADGATIRFTSSSGPGSNLWKPTKQEGTLATQTVRYVYQDVEGVTRPTYAVAPEPAGLGFSCVAKIENSEKLEKGCRALEFKYSTATTATGEKKSEWGEYKGRLKEVQFAAYNPSSKAMAETAVAEYSYDAQGRLRAEWNPQISPALKTVYGYDAEGHVTAVTAPGQESWALTYGTLGADPMREALADMSTGRLLKVTQAPASAKLWDGEAPKATEAPKLSGSPIADVTLGVSHGGWSNEPVAYAYQWEECSANGQECTPIAGATNENYTLTSKDVGHTVMALVTAINGGGSTVAASLVSGEVKAPEFTTYSLPETSAPRDIIEGPDKNLWFTDESTGKIGKITTSGTITEYSLSPDSFPEGITQGPDKNLWFTEVGTSKVGKITTSGTITEYALPSGSAPAHIVAGPDGNLWFAEHGTSKIGKITTEGVVSEYSLPEGSEPHGIAAGPDGNLWFTDEGTGKIGKITTSGTVTEYADAVRRALPPHEIVEGPDKNLWFTAGEGYGAYLDGGYPISFDRIGKITTAGVVSEYALPLENTGVPSGITVGPDKNLWFTTPKVVGRITTAGVISEYAAVPSGGKAAGITAGSDGNLWIAYGPGTTGVNEIGKMSPSVATEGERYAPGPGTTIEYRVPVSPWYLGPEGQGLPEMKEEEVKKWGQTDDPVEATAIFPPDEPQGWPASDYRRATIDYMDAKGRTVNTASPGEAISTTEYNADNDVTRTLSPDNRAAALKENCESKEKCKSAEVSRLLDTENTYEEKGGEPGTELLSTLGPQHQVGLAGGGHEQARTHTVYSYNEGAPAEGGPYRLVTKTTQGALAEGIETEVRTTTTSYSGQENLGWKLRAPTSVTTDPSGLKLTHTTVYEKETGDVIEAKSPEGKDAPAMLTEFIDNDNSVDFGLADGAAVAGNGDVWVVELGAHFAEPHDRLNELNERGELLKSVAPEGTADGDLKAPTAIAIDSKGNIWVADAGNSRVEEFNEKGEYENAWAASGTAQGIATFNGDVWVSDGWSSKTVQEYSEKGEALKSLTVSSPTGVAVDSKGDVWVTEWYGGVIEFNEKGERLRSFGTWGSGNGQFKDPDGIVAGPEGNVFVFDYGDERVEEFNEHGEYVGQFGSAGEGEGQFNVQTEPSGMAMNAEGDIYVTDNYHVEKWATPAALGNQGASATRTIYYSAGEEAEVAACRKHPEWANLPCQTKPATQPDTDGLPELPVTTIASYNVWDEPEKTEETVGSATRTKTATYDAAGRLKTSAISSGAGAALPTITYEYNSETGALVKQCANEGKPCSEGKPKTITSAYNTLGQLTSYTDADESTATYEYEKEKDYRLLKVNDGKGTQTYTYNETTGLLGELVDSGAGKFTATYDVEGNMLTESYPNAMTAYYAYNQTGAVTGLEYKKTVNCAKSCPEVWFSDTVAPSIHGQWIEQTSTLSHEKYGYDAAGRLIQVQDTPAGKGCTTRVYAYDEATNRTSLTTREPKPGGECASEGGSVEKHAYDTASRLLDPGVKYNEFGDITALPAVDAGGTELTSTYYSDNQLDTQTQNGQTVGYNLDPAGRTLETVLTGKRAETTTNHYAGPGSSPAWSANTAGEWTRNISGIGGFAAVQHGAETPVLQLTNLHGDVIATAQDSETATGLASTADTSEFGVPTTSLPPKYSWLGADEIPTELPSGVLNMGARSYVPGLGRFLQPDPRPGGSANAYTYTFGDPVNTSDPSGESTFYELLAGHAAEVGHESQVKEEAEIAARHTAEEAAARREAEFRAELADQDALAAAGPQYGGGEEEEWWEEEEGGYEYASYQHGAKPSSEGHMESALLVQPLVGEVSAESTNALGSAVPQCTTGTERPCAWDVSISGCHSEACAVKHSKYYRKKEGGSRCEQYGGHWAGNVCKGTRSGGEGTMGWAYQVLARAFEAADVKECTDDGVCERAWFDITEAIAASG